MTGAMETEDAPGTIAEIWMSGARARIACLVPQKGTMCLLDSVAAFSADEISCRAISHLDPTNPLIWNGRLGILCGCEYGMQAAALHGALDTIEKLLPSDRRSFVPTQGRVASLRVTSVPVARLDDPTIGVLRVTARKRAATAGGAQYDFELAAEDGLVLLTGTGTIALRPMATPP